MVVVVVLAVAPLSLGLMTSSIRIASNNGTTIPSATTITTTDITAASFQYKLLNDIASLLVEQINSICMYSQISSYEEYLEEYARVLAHKISCLSSITRGFNCSNKTQAPEHFVHIFEQAAAAAANVFLVSSSSSSSISESSVTSIMSHSPIVRVKAVMFFHRMVVSIGSRSLLYISRCMGAIITSAESSDIEEITQLLNQLMLEFQIEASSMIESLMGLVTRKYQSLIVATTMITTLPISSSSSINGGDNSGGSISDEVGSPAAAVGSSAWSMQPGESERLLLQKLYLLFIQHVATQNCSSALSADSNMQYLEGIFTTIINSIKGMSIVGNNNISASPSSSPIGSVTTKVLNPQASLPLRKCSLCILVGLSKVWLVAANSVNDGGSSHQLQQQQQQENITRLQTAFREFVFNQALPSILLCCTDGKSLNVKDAASQAILTETAALLWTVHSVLGREIVCSYFLSMLPSISWPPQIIQMFLEQLTATTTLSSSTSSNPPLGTYKETFRQFIRVCSSNGGGGGGGN